MTPKYDDDVGTTDRWLMEILMELGSVDTIFASLCRSIERMNPGIAVALLHHDRQSEELEVLAAPSLSEQFVASLTSFDPSMKDRDAGSNFWCLESQGRNYETEVSLLAIDQHSEEPAPALDVDSIRGAMRLANRIFARQRVSMPLQREIQTEAAYIN